MDEEREELAKKLPKGISTTFISSLTGEGIDQLKDKIWGLLNDSTAAK